MNVQRLGQRLLPLLAVVLALMLLAAPQAAAAGFGAGVKLCLYSVLPALFPFFVVCDILCACPLPSALTRPLAKITGLKSEAAAAALGLSWVGGYAVCAKLTAGLRAQNQIDGRDAALLLLLGCCSGPGFVIGCVGQHLLGSTALGVVLYVLQLAANLLCAALLVPLLPAAGAKAKKLPQPGTGVNLPGAIDGAVGSSLAVCGCVVFYSVVAAVLPLPGAAGAALHTALEISGGCAAFAALGGAPALYGCCVALSVLGLSVFSQLAVLLQGAAPLRLLALARLLHAGIFALLVRFACRMLPGAAAAVSTLAPRVIAMNRLPPDAACVGAVFLCAALYKVRQSLYNKRNPQR